MPVSSASFISSDSLSTVVVCHHYYRVLLLQILQSFNCLGCARFLSAFLLILVLIVLLRFYLSSRKLVLLLLLFIPSSFALGPVFLAIQQLVFLFFPSIFT